MDLQQELTAIDAVLAELSKGRNPHYHKLVNQMAQRLKCLLKEKGITLAQLIAGNLGEEELIGGPTIKDSTRRVYSDTLRTVLNHLCERGVTALAYDRCIIPATGMSPHRLPRGLTGFPEAVLGIYPAWLVPERFQRGIDNNAAVPETIRAEFRSFAEVEKHELNERSLQCYWGNVQTLAAGLGLKSLSELAEPDAIGRLSKFIEERGYTKKTSTVNHWRKVLRHVIGARNPFDRKNDFGDFLLRLPKSRAKAPIKEGASFRKNGKHHILIGGEIMEERIKMSDLKRLLATPIESTDLRELQEDVLCRFLAVLKDRPVELYARDFFSWKLLQPIQGNEESQLYGGDGYIFNNFRESIRKNRTDKPFPRWLGTRLDRLWTARRSYFGGKGDLDLRPSADPGILRPDKPLWVDPRTGHRASQGQLLNWTRKGLVRAGFKEDVADRASVKWFRRGIITAEYHNAAAFDAVCVVSGHDDHVGRRDYLGREMPSLVALEREQYWRPMGIAGNTARPLPVPRERPRLEVSRSSSAVAEPPAPGDWLPTAMAAQRLGKSTDTLLRWAQGGLIARQEQDGSPVYSARDIDSVRDHYVTPQMAGKMSEVSDSYVRRLCREERIPGLKRIGRKTYLIPVGIAKRLKEIGTAPQMRNPDGGGFGTGASLGL